MPMARESPSKCLTGGLHFCKRSARAKLSLWSSSRRGRFAVRAGPGNSLEVAAAQQRHGVAGTAVVKLPKSRENLHARRTAPLCPGSRTPCAFPSSPCDPFARTCIVRRVLARSLSTCIWCSSYALESREASMEIVVATPGHIDAMTAITDAAVADMAARGLDQWQCGYPCRATWEADVAEGAAYVALDEGRVVGVFRYGTEPEAAYDTLEGSWLASGPYATVHRCAVDPVCRGLGACGHPCRQRPYAPRHREGRLHLLRPHRAHGRRRGRRPAHRLRESAGVKASPIAAGGSATSCVERPGAWRVVL